jgi:predicted Zn-dependent protease
MVTRRRGGARRCEWDPRCDGVAGSVPWSCPSRCKRSFGRAATGAFAGHARGCGSIRGSAPGRARRKHSGDRAKPRRRDRERSRPGRSVPSQGARHDNGRRLPNAPPQEGEAHAAYQKAREHRATLGEIDAALLDAAEPRFRDPPDRAERTRRLEEVAKRYPSNVAILAILATRLTESDRYDDAEKAAERALALDPHYVPAIEAKIHVARRTGDVSKIRRLADDCVKTCPAATVCLQERIDLAHEDGRCADVKADARRWLAIDPTSSPAYAHLADAIASLGEPIEAVVEAVRRADANISDPDKRHFQEFDSIVSLAELQGDFSAAEKALSDRVAFAASRPNLDPTGPAAEHIVVVLEEGEPARARALLSALRSRRIASGIGEYNFPAESAIAIFSMRAGLLTRNQWRAERQRLVALQAEADTRRGGTEDPLEVWGNAYWVAPESADEAADALENLPRLGGVGETLVAGNKFPRQFGMTYAFAGRGAEAIPLLDRLTRDCRQYSSGMWFPVYWHALALAKEQTGDLAGAKVAYDRVLASWGNAKPRSVTADKARAGLARLAKASPGATAR